MAREIDEPFLPGTSSQVETQQSTLFTHDPISAEMSFRKVKIRPNYSPDDLPFERFYVPLLSRSVSYDRAVGYWSAAELQFAAQGTAHFLANGGRIRLIVGAQLIQKDVDAVLNGTPLEEVVAARLLADPDLEGRNIVAHDHLSVLAWMVATGRLEIRVGIPRDKSGRLLTHKESGRYFHTKYGIFTDQYGNRVAFSGSNNSSVTAWVRNHETFDVYPSWNAPIWEWSGEAKVVDFEKHWNQRADEGWAVIDLPQAVKRHLIEFAPISLPTQPEADDQEFNQTESDALTDVELTTIDIDAAWAELVALAEASTRPWTGVSTAWARPLPHQAELINRVVSTYPRGYLFADEVGLGKTVEAGMVLRELFTRGLAKKALLLVPASVMKQWQEELHEKMNLDVPRYDKGGFVDRFDQPIEVDPSVNPWSAFPIVLASSHLARRRSRRTELLNAGPWDVVLVDEAHHARRKGSKPSDPPNSLLSLLQEMKERETWRVLYLASATPMQMYPHEAWDLIELFNLKGKWGQQAFFFTQYFTFLGDPPAKRGWKILCEMLGDYFSDPHADYDHELATQVEQPAPEGLGWAGAHTVLNLQDNEPSADMRAQFPNSTSEWMDKWLRRHNPMRDRVFRNTRNTMREYQTARIIPADVVIPTRHVEDEFIGLADNERLLYDRIEEYIRRHYNAYKNDQTNQALGFIMTVYRRRLTSSFEAIKRSLRRRLEVLSQGKNLEELLADDDNLDIENSLFDSDEFDVSADRLRDEISELRDFLSELDKISGEDTKATHLVGDITQSLHAYDSVVVFTQYGDTMDYVRERLLAAGFYRVGCYSGRGGEVYDHASGTWTKVSKADIKNKFRNKELEVLIGTDSMSEGLNLQTSGRLINYDMPWNLMRVEQRIGRVDRIGATYRDIRISNYFYKDTVEEQVYRGIADGYGDFTKIVGDAAPVLANVEKAIEQLALAENVSHDAIAAEVADIKQQADGLTSRPVQNNDMGTAPDVTGQIRQPPVLAGDTTLADLERILTNNPLTTRYLVPDADAQHIYWLSSPGDDLSTISFAPAAGVETPEDYLQVSNEAVAIPITFDRDAWDASRDVDLVLLTYGTPQLANLLPASPGNLQ
ncbi:helicase-related protein [Streptomyces sp. NPDC005551]|uniref:helicase-related protein n=1 Tax=Streptomyces sp. NPDC005551 TaxID=3364725 RepID=UPI00367DF0D8